MTAVIFEVGKPYWEIAKRFHTHRATSKMIGPTAVRDMERLQNETHSDAVRKRISGFITRNRTKPPGSLPPNDGPRYA